MLSIKSVVRKALPEMKRRGEFVINKYIDSAEPEEWIELSRAWRNRSQLSMAERAVRRGMKENPEHLGLIQEYIEIARLRRDWAQVEKLCDMAINKFGLETTPDIWNARDEAKTNQKERTRRHELLRTSFKNEKTIHVTDANLTMLDKQAMLKELAKINKSSVSWEVPKKYQSRNSNDLISVIILVLDNLELTTRCVKSIFDTKTNLDFELLLINNGSTASTIEGLRNLHRRYPVMKLIHSEQNLNFSLGNNLGFSEAKGNICIFLNNDTYVTDFWMDNLVSSLKAQEVRVAQPTLLYPDETIQNIGIVFSNKSTLGYPLYAGRMGSNKKLIKDRRLQAVTAACMAVRSEDFALIKGFNTAFVNGQEDVDFCLRLINKIGGTCYCTKDSIVYHDEGKSSGRGRYYVHNRSQFIKNWRGKIVPDDEGHYKKDGYYVKSWQLDSEANLAASIELYRPVLEKNNAEKI